MRLKYGSRKPSEHSSSMLPRAHRKIPSQELPEKEELTGWSKKIELSIEAP
jgi:hypothetical protein